MRGRRSVVDDYGKESIDESEIPIHSSPTSEYVYFKRKRFVCVHRKDFNPVGQPADCSVHFTAECFTQAFYEKGTRKYLKPGTVPTIRKKTSEIISKRDHRMVGEYLFAVCANITCAVRYTFRHIPKRYFVRLSCAYTCISPDRFRLNCIICAPSNELFSVLPPSRLGDTQKLFLFNLATCHAVSRK